MKYFALIFLSAVSLFLPHLSWAGKNALGFDDRISYDVYFSTNRETTTLIKDVAIIGLTEIGGESFLIVKPTAFKLAETDGFILFDSITAILPNGNFRILPDQKITIIK